MSYLVATSRCPISHESLENRGSVKENVGGVATALKRMLGENGGTWVCWGNGKADSHYPVENVGRYKVVRVFLSREEKTGFYDQFSNETLWPLFHYFRSRIKFSKSSYSYYLKVNEKFRDKILENISNDTDIWIHDYQLALLPKLLREARINNHITFTWHIPWVSEEFFSILPEARQIIQSITSSDLITFHTRLYRDHFLSCTKRFLGRETGIKSKVLAVPLGIDTSYYSPRKTIPTSLANIKNKDIIFSIDRLDYTKGLVNRVMAIDALLKKHSILRGKFVYIMVVNPSRTTISEYRAMKRELEMNIGRVNGKYGDFSWMPIIYMYRSISDNLLKSLYTRAKIAFIAPLIDGLNLVSKEFVSVSEDGIIIISKFAGAAEELSGAVKVNPYSIGDMADALFVALNMKEDEIRGRMNQMKHIVTKHDLNWWLSTILRTIRKQKRSANAWNVNGSD